jgi:SAM-dependent methyltransferase
LSREASKTRALWSAEIRRIFDGDGIDIGCGDDPIVPQAMRFDREHGDAQYITHHVDRAFDYVFSSHVLEHMADPAAALVDWFKLVKPGGHLIALVPDEDLYEQGVFPSLFNDDHKHTFTIAKGRSWSPVSRNAMDLARSLGGTLVSLELQDLGYDRRLLCHSPGRRGLGLFVLHRRLARRFPALCRRPAMALFLNRLGMPIDQTAFPDDRLAQIQLIVRKPSGAAS